MRRGIRRLLSPGAVEEEMDQVLVEADPLLLILNNQKIREWV